jgi:hypothetical protein
MEIINPNEAETLKNNTGEETQDQTNEDTKVEGQDDGGNVEKQEGQETTDQNQTENPFEVKLKELETRDRQKAGAIKEKNKTIQDLQERLKAKETEVDNTGYVDTDEVVKKLKDEITTLKESVAKDVAEAKQMAAEERLERKISGLSANEGQRKLIRYFFDNKSNPSLSLDERLDQAVAQTNTIIAGDQKLQQEIEKATNSSIQTKGKRDNKASAWSEEDKTFANTILQTDAGRKKFEELGKRNS